MSCERNHALPTLARLAGVAEADRDRAWQAAEAWAAAEALRSPDADLIAQLWGGSGHGGPTDAARRALIAAIATSRAGAEQVLIACPGFDHPRRWQAAMAEHPAAWAAAQQIVADPDRATPEPWAAVAAHPPAAAAVLSRVSAARRRAEVVDAARQQPRAVGWAVVADPRLLELPAIHAAVVGEAYQTAEVVQECPERCAHPDLLARTATDAFWSEWVVREAGWHPALWRGMTGAPRRRWAEWRGRDVGELDGIAARWPAIPAAARAARAGLPRSISLPEEGGDR